MGGEGQGLDSVYIPLPWSFSDALCPNPVSTGFPKLSSLIPGHSINNIYALLSWGLGPRALKSSHEPWRHGGEV